MPQSVHAVCPVAFPYLPAPQAVQSPLPAADLYLPATHAEQLPSADVLALPKKPALQVQAVKAALPAGELEYIGHDSHFELGEAFSAVENVPGWHLTHVEAPTAVEYVPAIHVLQCRNPFCAE